MKVPLSLLKKYLNLELSPEEIAAVLTTGGIEVESIDTTPLSFTGVVVGEVIEAHPHPHADHLRVATVSDGTETFQVVCGAPNCRAGIKTAFAKIGAVLTDIQGKTFKIKKAKLRDIESYGMLCAADELGLGFSEGILEFSDLPVGADLGSLHADPILDVSLTPNLGHCLSIQGIARELSAFLNLPLKSIPMDFKEEGEAIEKCIRVQVIDQRRAPRYACRVATDVRVGPSPEALKKKIEACGMRSVNNVVDIGNLVMVMMGQPLHLFDLDQIADHTILVTAETDFKEMETLDDAVRAIPGESLLICDPKKPLAFAGIMGGKSAEVSEATTRILIEAAHFIPEAIRKTSKLLGLKSEASQRFEKGTDPNAVLKALDFAAHLLQKFAGAKIAKGVIDHASHVFVPKKIACRPHRVNQILGTELSVSEMTELLTRLDFLVIEETAQQFVVAVPTYRNDIKEEIDLIEEIARLYGYNLLPKRLPRHVTSPLFHTPLFELEKKAREQLIGLGLQEMLTCDLIHPDLAQLTAENAMKQDALISVLHPSSIDQSVLRASLLSGLLQTVKYNCDRNNPAIAGFEVGRIHFKEEDRYLEPTMAGIILTGPSLPYHWDPKPKNFDFFDLKGIVLNFLEGLHIKEAVLEISHLHNFHPGRQARLKIKETAIGVLGEIHPDHLLKMGIDQKVYYAEINLHLLIPHLAKNRLVSPIAQFPGSERDWTLTLEETVPVGFILESVRAIPSRLLEKVQLLDLYKSDQIGKDKKNATFRFFYRDLEKTIAYETVEREHGRILQTITEKLKSRTGSL